MVKGAPQDPRPAALAILVLRAKALASWPSPQVTQVRGLPLAGPPRVTAPRDPGAPVESSPSPRLLLPARDLSTEVGCRREKGATTSDTPGQERCCRGRCPNGSGPAGGRGPGRGAGEPRKVQGGEHLGAPSSRWRREARTLCPRGISPEERGGGQRTFSSEERRPFQSSDEEQDCKPCKDGEAPVRGLLQAVS